jgi:hypothetical protein
MSNWLALHLVQVPIQIPCAQSSLDGRLPTHITPPDPQSLPCNTPYQRGSECCGRPLELCRIGPGQSVPLADDNPSDILLTQRFHQHLSKQIPAGFPISPLPKKVLSWIAVVLQTYESYLMANRKAPTSPKTVAGIAGLDSATKPASLLTPSSLPYPNRKSMSLPRLSSRASKQLLELKTANLWDLTNEQ